MSNVVVPKLNNNDSTYTFVGWLVPDGGPVREGDAVAEVETSKTTCEVLCQRAGVLHHLVERDAECQPGDVIARVFATAQGREDFIAAAKDPGEGTDGSRANDPVVTESAWTLARDTGVSLDELRGLGKRIVRRADVEHLISARSSG